MNSLTVGGLIVGLVTDFIYVCVALKNKKQPDLGAAGNILIAAVGIAGAIRLVGNVLTGEFLKSVEFQDGHNHGGTWNLAAEDCVLVVLGGLALTWVSCKGVWESFAAVKSPRN